MNMQPNKRAFGLALLCTTALTLALAGNAHGHGGEVVEDVPEGMVQSKVTERPDVAGLQIMLLEGVHQGLLVVYQGDDTLLFHGEEGEPFLRFTKDQVEANRQSETWQAMGKDTDADASRGETDWVSVANTGRYAWTDPRLTLTRKPEQTGKEHTLGKWHIHMARASDDECNGISGVHYWQPLDEAGTAQASKGGGHNH
jgi:hypothetical protein